MCCTYWNVAQWVWVNKIGYALIYLGGRANMWQTTDELKKCFIACTLDINLINNFQPLNMWWNGMAAQPQAHIGVCRCRCECASMHVYNVRSTHEYSTECWARDKLISASKGPKNIINVMNSHWWHTFPKWSNSNGTHTSTYFQRDMLCTDSTTLPSMALVFSWMQQRWNRSPKCQLYGKSRHLIPEKFVKIRACLIMRHTKLRPFDFPSYNYFV